MFSAGLIFYLMLVGKAAFPGKTYNEVLAQNRACHINFEGPEFQSVSKEVLTLLRKMLEKDPRERISAG